MINSFLMFLTATMLLFNPVDTTEMRLVCYYTNWSVYRHANTPILYPDSIDPSLCTHLHVAFALINPTTLKIEASEKHDTHFTDVFNTPLFLRMHKLKRRKSSLKLLVAVGGWTAASEAFNNIVANETSRAIFIQQTKEFLYQWNFDGVDLDWEFPGDLRRGAANDSRENFNLLIQEMSEAFQKENPHFLLTAAVAADPTRIDNGYIIPDLCRYMDYVSVMTYDYNGAWDNVTGINAPLYGRKNLSDDDDSRWKNVNYSMHYWLDRGCPASKLNLGLAAYGRTFTLGNESTSTAIGTDILGPGLAGPYTKENGTLAYFEICQKLRLFNWTTAYDNESQVPYAFSSKSSSSGQQWVGYDDLKSITAKVLYAKEMKFGGTMIWSLDQDDYTGLFCRQGQFPLTQLVQELISTPNHTYEREFTKSSARPQTRPPKHKASVVPIRTVTLSANIVPSVKSSVGLNVPKTDLIWMHCLLLVIALICTRFD